MRLLRSRFPNAPARVLAVLVLPGAMAMPAHAQDTTPPSRETAPCKAPAHRQFDFWIGNWDVRSGAGETAGRSRVTSEFGGCVLREQWTSANGRAGSSFNIFDAGTGRWHQTWVDDGGMLLLLDGSVREDGAIMLQGERRRPDGGTVRHRITWTPLGADALRQLWEVSSDGGSSWRTLFDGHYQRAR
ncbi:MAG TPA: hypothetical protein VK939_06630 [Longimicrobiales bacterium]|nr:hypothetical protein [Longimicrobiales bacterium]